MWAVLPWVPRPPLVGLSAALAVVAALAALNGSSLLKRRPPALAVLGALAMAEERGVRIEILAAGPGDWRRDGRIADPSSWSLSLPEGVVATPEVVEVLPDRKKTLFLIRCYLKDWEPVPRFQGVPFVLRGPDGSAAVGVARLDRLDQGRSKLKRPRVTWKSLAA